MSATNTTTNYNLPIFIGSDKPAWLVDFNGAMNAIDAQMKVNADAIAGKSPILTFDDTTDIDFTVTSNTVTANLASGVSDKVGRALVTPISAPAADQLVAVNTSGNQAAYDIGSGLYKDGGVLRAVDLDLVNTGAVTVTSQTTGVTVESNTLRYALNADKSIGKIYGKIYLKNSSGSSSTGVVANLTTDLTVKAPGAAFTIEPVGVTPDFVGAITANISAAGAVSLSVPARGGNSTTHGFVYPCIYFFADFGDTPTP